MGWRFARDAAKIERYIYLLSRTRSSPMVKSSALTPAIELATASPARFPGESDDYRAARTALLAEEIELRRHIEYVAQLRRQLPRGGLIPDDYVFQGAEGPINFSALFGQHDTLITYSWMFGPQRERPCPMCTCMLSALDGEMSDLAQRVAFVVFATSPVERMQAFASERGWRALRLFSSSGNTFNRDYAFETESSGDNAAVNVFQREADGIRHFWGGEMGSGTADPGQDPRGAPDLMPLWNILDMTPAGRGADWYPKLDY